MNALNSFESDLRRAVLSLRFLVAVGMQLAILLTDGYGSTLYQMSVPLACTLPYASGWLEEYKGGFVRLALVRTTMRGYILGKYFGCTVAGGCAEVLALWLYTRLQGEPAPCSYGTLFLTAAVWAGTATVLAALSNSKYLAYGGAFVVCYFLVILCERYWPGLYCLYPYEWLEPTHTWVWGGIGLNLLLAALAGVLLLWYWLILQGRVERG